MRKPGRLPLQPKRKVGIPLHPDRQAPNARGVPRLPDHHAARAAVCRGQLEGNAQRGPCKDCKPMTKPVSAPTPYYTTPLGKAFLGDSLSLLPTLPDASLNLILTSPPYALHFKKAYGNEDQHRYVKWFLPFARQYHRLLKDDGSLVIDIGGAWQPGQPTRSLYHFELLIALCRQAGFHLAQEFYWYNPAKLPSPAEWVNVRKLRVKDAVNCLWWLSKTPWPKANNQKVLQEYSPDMHRLLKRGYRLKQRPSGHH